MAERVNSYILILNSPAVTANRMWTQRTASPPTQECALDLTRNRLTDCSIYGRFGCSDLTKKNWGPPFDPKSNSRQITGGLTQNMSVPCPLCGKPCFAWCCQTNANLSLFVGGSSNLCSTKLLPFIECRR